MAEIFNRHEYKYLVDPETMRSVSLGLSGYAHPDAHGMDGSYRVTSLYFDTTDELFYLQTLDNLPFRQKLRLRIYGKYSPGDLSFLEIKQRHHGLVHKRRLPLPLDLAYAGAVPGADEPLDLRGTNLQIFREASFLVNYFTLRPKIVVSYRRQAYVGRDDSELRITFDSDLRFWTGKLKVEKPEHSMQVFQDDKVIMEIKSNKALPPWLSRLVTDNECGKLKLSKYCLSMAARPAVNIKQTGVGIHGRAV